MIQNDFTNYPKKYSLGRSNWRSFDAGIEYEWLITNGLGGYAALSCIGANTRLFSGLLNISLNPPADRYTLLANITERVVCADETVADFNTCRTIFETIEGQKYLNHFDFDAYPEFTYQYSDFTMKKSIGMVYGKNTSVVCYTVRNGLKPRKLVLTPDFTYKVLGSSVNRDQLAFSKVLDGQSLTLTPDANKDVHIHFSASEGQYVDRSTYPVSMAVPTHEYKSGLLYNLDVRNGFNDSDCFYTPYDIEIDIAPGETKCFYVVCSTSPEEVNGFDVLEDMLSRKKSLSDNLPVKDGLLERLVYSGDNFIVERKSTGFKSVLAGFPWFLDWGRDTMIAFTGLTLSTHRFDDARSILISFAKYIKDGLLPNVFPDTSEDQPYYNTMDASMWYFYAVYKYLQYDKSPEATAFINQEIYPVLEQIIDNYKKGTHFSIHMDDDFLISGGSDFDQITWMDVRVGDWVVTPRHGKPVEINALWYNALRIMAELSDSDKASEYNALADKVKVSFEKKFWNEADQCLYDVVGKTADGADDPDSRIRPNQIVAVSLPFPVISADKERLITDKVYELLYTPIGIRSLSPNDPEYKKEYIGRLILRDGAYHMGTSWGYITGMFITAYVKTHGYTDEAVETALSLLTPMIDHLNDGCLGGVAEIFDGDFPCTSRGCYSQAWSVAELTRAYYEDILKLNH